jgi:outer membrane receptor for ferrienterochelin and colicin
MNMIKWDKKFSWMPKVLFMLFFILLGFVPLDAQECRVHGQLTDSLTQEAIIGAAVIYSSPTMLLPKGVFTDAEGKFSFVVPDTGWYAFEVKRTGYASKQHTVYIQDTSYYYILSLVPVQQALQEVEIVDKREEIEHNIGRKTYRVSDQAMHVTGSAKDLLISLPSVDVDAEGKLSYRGSNKILIIIDGEQSNLVQSLDQIPADQIDFIEVINNPPVKYRAEGASGLIHVHTKKQLKQRYASSVNVYAGLPENMGASLGYAFNGKKWSFYFRPGFKRKKQFQTKEHWRDNFENPWAQDYYQFDRQDETLNNLTVNTGLTYRFNKKQTLDLKVLANSKWDGADRSIFYQTNKKNGEQVYASDKDIEISNTNSAIDLGLNYKLKGKRKKEEFNARGNYSYFKQLFILNNSWLNEGSIINPNLQNTRTLQDNRVAGLDVDYQYPLTDSIWLYTGYALNYSDLINDFKSESYNYLAEDWLLDSSIINYFHFLQQIHAVFAGFGSTFRNGGLDLGVRMEHTQIEQNDTSRNRYLNFFPRIQLYHRLANSMRLSIGFSQRINRPTLRMFNPYVREFADILNMHRGNPYLKPEYVSSFDLSLRQVRKRTSWELSVYFRDVNDAISRVKYGTNDSAFLVTFMNFDQGRFIGLEPSVSFKKEGKWQISFSANIFHSYLEGEYESNSVKREHWVYHLNMSSSVKLSYGFHLRAQAFYRSSMPSVFGVYMNRYWMDMSLSKAVLNGKGRVIFKLSDVFNTWMYGLDLTATGPDLYAYSQRNRRKNQSQYFSLGFQYNVSGGEKKNKKKGNFYLDGVQKQ